MAEIQTFPFIIVACLISKSGFRLPRPFHSLVHRAVNKFSIPYNNYFKNIEITWNK